MAMTAIDPEQAREDIAGGARQASQDGLSSAEALRLLDRFGPNAVPDVADHPLQMVLAKFWAPVPWMLEAAILLQLVLGEYYEALAIAVLLSFNAVLGFIQESRAQATLDALKSRLALMASVRRDRAWKIIPAAGLVRGDIVKLSLGTVVPADVPCRSKAARAANPMPARWCDAARRSRKSRRPVHVPSSDARPS